MLVGDFAPDQFRRRLAGTGFGVRIGPFDIGVRCPIAAIATPLQQLYRHYPVLRPDSARSCEVALLPARQWWPRPRWLVRFLVDGRAPHPDMPAAHGLCVLEWGINLVLALRYHCYVMLHAAVVERNGQALVMPGQPGSGKSTLCAALVSRGWRLLSDEFGLLRPGGREFWPVPRPMPLKNESIGVMRAFAPDAFLGPVVCGTRKGDVAHFRPPADSVARADQPAAARWIVCPQWQRGSELRLEPMRGAECFAALATNAFNYEMLGEAAFDTVVGMLSNASIYRLNYDSLAEAVARLTAMADHDATVA